MTPPTSWSLVETEGNPDGFQEFLVAVRGEVIAFGRPVDCATVIRTISVLTSRCSMLRENGSKC
jgi:hypothetical protein